MIIFNIVPYNSLVDPGPIAWKVPRGGGAGILIRLVGSTLKKKKIKSQNLWGNSGSGIHLFLVLIPLYLKPGFCPRICVADNMVAVAVQWQITLDMTDNISIFRAILVMSLSILKRQIYLKIYCLLDHVTRTSKKDWMSPRRGSKGDSPPMLSAIRNLPGR